MSDPTSAGGILVAAAQGQAWPGAAQWLNVAGDAVMGAALIAIPFALAWFTRRRPDLAFRPIFPVLTLFLMACGMTHIMGIVDVWQPIDWYEGAVKLVGALAAIGTALVLVPLLPRALALPSSHALQQINAELEHEITLRVNAELDLRAAYQELEERVAQRTRELSQANERLTQEIQERGRTEQALRYSETLLRRMHDELEDHIAERTAELTRTIGELEAFSYSISHDLRAPLRAINGYAAILDEEHGAGLGSEGRELLERIASNASKMAQLIDGLLDFSRLARTESIVAEVDMKPLIQAVAGELRSDRDAGRAELVIGDLPRARGDEGMLRQVWMNLLANAFKFSVRARQPRVEVSAHKSGNEIVYRVADNGVGFDMAYAEKLFGVFNRLHSASDFPGVGVGLAIVRRIVQRHGGRVWAESSPGQGSTFYFTLPATRAETATAN